MAKRVQSEFQQHHLFNNQHCDQSIDSFCEVAGHSSAESTTIVGQTSSSGNHHQRGRSIIRDPTYTALPTVGGGRLSSGSIRDDYETTSPLEESLAVRRVRIASGQIDPTLLSDQEWKSIEDDTFRERALEEKCGVFGVISNGEWPTALDVAQIICLGLVGLQHRGQESAGIVTCKSKQDPLSVSRAEGLVSSAFNEMSMMSLKGNLGIGHTRYSTTGGSGSIQLAQPFVVHTKYGTIAVAHNGELVNSRNLRETLLSHGVGLSTGSDSELITQCLSQTPPDRFKHPKFRLKSTTTTKAETTSTTNGRGAASAASASSSKSHRGASDDENDDDVDAPKPQIGAPVWKTDDLDADENNIASRLLYLMSLTPVSYSLIVMYNECLYATRDSFGNRPLTIGMLVPPANAGDITGLPYSEIDQCYVEGWCISSESCPFPSVHAKLKRDVGPGEIVKFSQGKDPKTLAVMPRPIEATSPAFCIFEYVYFARPDSILENQTVYSVRRRCGERLADESPVLTRPDQDKRDFIVAPVPESSIPAALGYSQRSGIPYVEVFCKNRYVGRTFIQPSTRLRRLGVAKKFGPLTENFVGKSIILIDDSIVRGTTIGQLVRLLREAGAKEVHIRIASPPLHFPCYMGINIPTKEELIANDSSPEKFALQLGAASLKYLSVEGLRESVQYQIKRNLLADTKKLLANDASDVEDLMATTKQKSIGSATATINGSGGGGCCTGKAEQKLSDDKIEAKLRSKVGHCDACLTGKYPVELDR